AEVNDLGIVQYSSQYDYRLPSTNSISALETFAATASFNALAKWSEFAATRGIETFNVWVAMFMNDEVLAVYMLRQTAAFKDAALVRSRDAAKLAVCDVVVDVGGVYDVEKFRFDHHQRGFFETFSDKHKTKLSSAGLVYKHFGKEIIASELDLKQEDKDVDTLYVKVYDDFIEALDGTDNGINQYPLELTPAYKDSTNLHSRVGRLNPWWNQKVTDTERDSRFQEVTLLAGNELTSRIRFLGLSWLPARSIVSSAFDTSDLLSRVVVLEQPCPWSEHLLDVERERGITEERNILYVLYPDDSNDSWRIQCVGKKAGGFDNRKSLPESWRGLRDDELSEISKIPGCVFVHAGGFIGGTVHEISRIHYCSLFRFSCLDLTNHALVPS
ncbi:hypothetical protein BC938DRAFT_483401, partial [Jimgerdemannia flammicorona]